MSSSNSHADLSQPRSHAMGLITKEGKEHIQIHSAESSSQYKPQYTSGKKIPITPTPSHSSSPEADHSGSTTIANTQAEDLSTTNEKPELPSGSTTKQHEDPNFSRSRLVALYHKYNPQMIFENRGSTARDHLASERTFLAYVRTSLALASTGVALVQLFTIADLTSTATKTPVGEASKRIQKFARPLGVSSVIMALIMLGIATYRYFLIQGALPGNMFPVARFSVIFTTFVLSAVVVVIFAALLSGR